MINGIDGFLDRLSVLQFADQGVCISFRAVIFRFMASQLVVTPCGSVSFEASGSRLLSPHWYCGSHRLYDLLCP